jgi:hypothetical protein
MAVGFGNHRIEQSLGIALLAGGTTASRKRCRAGHGAFVDTMRLHGTTIVGGAL